MIEAPSGTRVCCVCEHLLARGRIVPPADHDGGKACCPQHDTAIPKAGDLGTANDLPGWEGQDRSDSVGTTTQPTVPNPPGWVPRGQNPVWTAPDDLLSEEGGGRERVDGHRQLRHQRRKALSRQYDIVEVRLEDRRKGWTSGIDQSGADRPPVELEFLDTPKPG